MNKEYKVFKQSIVMYQAQSGPNIKVYFHKAYKATNKNTLRRLHNQGWAPEVAITNGRPMTKEEANKFVALLNGQVAQGIEAQIEYLKKAA